MGHTHILEIMKLQQPFFVTLAKPLGPLNLARSSGIYSV